MFNIYSVNYASMSNEKSEDLFMLRKNTFKDRLQWAVDCSDGKEVDQFDNDKTNYIFGVENGMIICGTRMIDMKYQNMLNSTFSSFFNNVNIPEGNYIESTRFFVDKERTHSLLGLSLIHISTLKLACLQVDSRFKLIKSSGGGALRSAS